MSEFADYVQKQQALRRPPGAQPVPYEEHDELDIIDQLGLEEDSSHIRLKEVLLDKQTDPEVTVKALAEHLTMRLAEGHGEALFDLGLEDNGAPMGFSIDDWGFALERISMAAGEAKADYKVLMTRNVGGDVEVGPSGPKDKSSSGKLIIRRIPETVDDVIETRIAVVGNGKLHDSRLLHLS